jgi:putative NIF3 family GTP cyclohydrolase 1 type 2
MKRRDFIITAGLASISFNFSAVSPKEEIVTAADLQRFLRDLYPVGEPSVDRIIIGNPDTRIRKAGTVWTPYFETLKKAVSKGINVLIAHEPTFYMHWDLENLTEKGQAYFIDTPSPAKEQYLEALERKKRWIESNGLVIIRSHDVTDLICIPFGLGQQLGFNNEDIVRSKDYYNVYQVEKDTAANIARNIALKLRDLNQPGVAFYGDPGRAVSTVGLGTGCICDPRDYAEFNPDLCIGVDDTIKTWHQAYFAEDTGKPLVVINHGTSEEMGVRLLNEHLRRNIPSIEFIHINQGCDYKWITV